MCASTHADHLRVSDIPPESRDRVSGWEQTKTPFPRLLARFSIVEFTFTEVSHIFAIIQWP